MPILKAGNYYVNKNPRKSSFVNEIVPVQDIEVNEKVFSNYENKTIAVLRINDMVFRKPYNDILETTGAPQ